ncbi:MAG: PAS domain S-box protein [Rhodopila sp.]
MADSPTSDSITTSSRPVPAPSVTAAHYFPNHRGVIWMLVAVLLIVVALMVGAHRVILNRAQSDDTAAAWAVHYQEIVAGLNGILTSTDEVEASERGFLLTGKTDYLLPYYYRSIEAVWRNFSLVRDLVADNPRQQERLLALQDLLRSRQAELAHTIELAQNDDRSGALAIVNTGAELRQMDAIRGTISEMIAEEQRLLHARQSELERTHTVSQSILGGLLAATAGGIALGGAAVSWLLAMVSATKREAILVERQRLLDMMDLAAIMVRDFEGTIRFWSEGCRDLFGWTAEQAVGQSSHTLLKTVFPAPLDDIKAALLRDGSWRGEVRHCRQDGTEVIVFSHKVIRREADSSLTIMENVTDITDKRRAEAALHDNEARLRLVQAVGGIAAADRMLPNGQTVISEEFVKLYGLPPSHTQLSPAEFLALIHPDDRERMKQEADGIYKTGGTYATEFRIHPPGGAVRWVHLCTEVFLGEDGKPRRAISAQQDITELVAAREAQASYTIKLERQVAERTAALAAAEARFRAIFDSQFQFIGLLAPDGTTLEANRTLLEAAGLTRNDTIGRPFWETGWWPEAERDRLRQDIARAARGTVIRREVKNMGADGHEIWVDFSLKPVRDAATDEIMWIIPEGRDITEQHSLSSQLVQAQKVQALGQLASGIAHDFNNILQAVEGAATLIERRPEDIERTRRLARMAIDATGRGGSITQRLLSFARRGEIHAEALPTAELLNNIREVLAHTLGVTIVVQSIASPEVPRLIADRGQLETALVNLGTNARDAMPDGGLLTLSADVEHVAADGSHPAGLKPGTYVRLSVADTGTGMDAATLARATEAFFTTKPLGQGTGLGLPMVRAFAEQSGGAMSITSAHGEGTTVTLWLRQAMDTTAAAVGQADARNTTLDAPVRILLVDDDDMVRETLAAQLEDLGFGMLVASSGAEAVALLEAGGGS